MADNTEQIQRIKDKLPRARKVDIDLKVFGASSHKYRVHRPASEKQIVDFERKFGVGLPACYRAFVGEVGNGGVSYRDSAAGPDYGVYPLGANVDELIYADAEAYLRGECILRPDMSDEDWRTLREAVNGASGRLYGGILPIGSQGCTYLYGLVLTGNHRGRVLSLDIDGQKPHFSFEANFLDWYESWLDGIVL